MLSNKIPLIINKINKFVFNYDEFIMSKYCPKITYKEVNKLYKNKVFLECSKQKV